MQLQLRRAYGAGRNSEATKIRYFEGSIPKEDMRTTMSQIRTTWTLKKELPEKGRTQII